MAEIDLEDLPIARHIKSAFHLKGKIFLMQFGVKMFSNVDMRFAQGRADTLDTGNDINKTFVNIRAAVIVVIVLVDGDHFAAVFNGVFLFVLDCPHQDLPSCEC